MIAHSNKQIKIELMPRLHLRLHGPARLEDPPTSDDHGQVVCAQPRLRVRRVVVRIPRRTQDDVDGDPALESLLLEREILQLLQPVPLGSTVHDCVAEDDVPNTSVVDGRLARAAAAGALGVLEIPAVSVRVMEEARIVVPFV